MIVLFRLSANVVEERSEDVVFDSGVKVPTVE